MADVTSPSPGPGTRPSRRRRRLLFAFVAIVIGLVVAIAATEIALRIWDPLHLPLEDMRGFYRLDDHNRIETTPGWSGEQIVEDRPVPVNMNSLGLRGPEIGPRADGEKRVLMLGDSYVWGQGVENDETVPARLEAGLRANGHEVIVGNAGMFGAGPREWGYTLERYREAFDPDLLVAVMYVGNDVLDSLMEPLSVADGWLMISGTSELRDSWRFRLMVSSRVWNYVERLFAKNRIEDQLAAALARYRPGIPFRVDEAMFLDRDPARDAEEPFIAQVEALMADFFRELAKVAGDLPTLVVLLPGHVVAKNDYATLLKNYGLDPKLHERGRGHARLRRLLAAQGFEVVDLADRIFTDPKTRSLFLPQDAHFSARGCQKVADWLLPEIETRLK